MKAEEASNTVGQEMEQPPVAVNGGPSVTTDACTFIPNRYSLSSRRPHEGRDLVFKGRTYRIGLGRYADGTPAEIFIDAGKAGSEIQEHVSTVAVLVSLLLQHRIPIDTIKHSIDGVAAAALALFENSCTSPGAHDEQEKITRT
jgi:hypothetical protein